jgi:PAS domain S-box-containing protein
MSERKTRTRKSSGQIVPTALRRAVLRWHLVGSLAAVLVVGAAVVLVAVARQEAQEAVEVWRGRLAAMADDRASAIDRWLAEKLNHASVAAQLKSITALAAESPAPATPAAAARARADATLRLRLFLQTAVCRYAAVLDRNERVLASAGDLGPLDASCLKIVTLCLATARRHAEIHLHQGRTPLVQFVAPVFGPGGGKPLGAVLLAADPDDWLFPFLRHEPVPSTTGETVLMERRGDAAVFLSPLRHQPSAPLTFRKPLTVPRFAAAAALAGRETVSEYTDYRDVPIFAATRRLTDAPWGLVAKVDRAEVMQGFRHWLTSALAAWLGLAAAAAGLTFGVRYRQHLLLYEAVSAEQQRMAELVDSANDAVLVFTADGRVVQANQRAEAMYGYSQDELRRLTIADLRAPAVRDEAPTLHDGVLDRDGMIVKTRHQRRDGLEFPVEVSVRRTDHRGAGYVIQTIRDITERKRGEEALRQSEERYRFLFTNMVEGYAHCRMLFDGDVPIDFVYLDVNDAFERLTGLKDVTGRKVTEVIPGLRESNPELFEIYGRVALTGRPDAFETFVPQLGIWFAISVYSPARAHFVAVFQIITERKRAEEELRAAYARLERMFSSNIVGIAIANPDGGLLEVNDYYLDLLGFTRAEFDAGLIRWDERTPPEHLEADRRAIQELRSRGVCTPYEKEYVRKDGSRVWVYLADAMIPRPGEQILAFVLDVTERKRAEEALREAHEKLEVRVAERTRELDAANRELEAFSFSVSHDLRAPLRAIDGFSRVLQEDQGPRLDAEGQRVIGVIRESAQRLAQLIEDLLEFSRAGRAEMRAARVEMGRLVRAVLGELVQEPDWGRYEFDVGELPDATGDPALLRQVWANLLGNAIKFSAPREKPVIRVFATSDDGSVRYHVKDNGVGFDMKYKDKLFDVFQRLHSVKEFPGTGVGLAIVRRIVDRHGGTATAHGTLGEGAEFTFTLPATREEVS